MEFFLYSIRPDNRYHGTFSFHFTPPSSSSSSSSSSSPWSSRFGCKEDNAPPSTEGNYPKNPNTDKGEEEEEEEEEEEATSPTCIAHSRYVLPISSTPQPPRLCSPAPHPNHSHPPTHPASNHPPIQSPTFSPTQQDFLYIYSGKASVRDVMSLGLKGRIKVSGYRYADCGRFASSFDLRTEQWERFYGGGWVGRLREEIVEVVPPLGGWRKEEEEEEVEVGERMQRQRRRNSSPSLASLHSSSFSSSSSRLEAITRPLSPSPSPPPPLFSSPATTST